MSAYTFIIRYKYTGSSRISYKIEIWETPLGVFVADVLPMGSNVPIKTFRDAKYRRARYLAEKWVRSKR